jgi:hypothetical protein
VAHPKFEIPQDPHGKKRYESAMNHVEAAKEAGKSNDEIHVVFKKIMEFDPMDIDKIPTDEAHAKYRSAIIHVKAAKEKGMPVNEIHDMYKRIMSGTAGKHKAHA